MEWGLEASLLVADMTNRDPAKSSRLARVLFAKVELWLVLLLAILAGASSVLFAWIVKRTVTLPADARFVSPAALDLASVPDYARTLLESGVELGSGGLVQRNPQVIEVDSLGGLTIEDPSFREDGLLLVSAYDDDKGISTVYLYDLERRRRIFEWVPNYEQIVEKTPSLKALADAGEPIRGTNARRNFRSQAPLLLPDGSVVLNSGEGVLARLDTRGDVIWTSDHHYHHSIERTMEGNIIVPVAVIRNRDFRDDGYAILTPGGEVVDERFIVDILVENGYRGLVFGVGRWERDRIHLNDAQPILRTDDFVEAGDIVLSARHLSTVFLYRPSENRIIWLQTGPWMNQHDVDYVGNGRFVVFGNDWVRDSGDSPSPSVPEEPGWRRTGHSNIYLYDMNTRETTTPYEDIFDRYTLRTPTQGSQRLLDNGDAFLSLTDEHQLLRLNNEVIRWRYASPIGDDAVGALHWSRYFYRDELDLSWMEGLDPSTSGA